MNLECEACRESVNVPVLRLTERDDLWCIECPTCGELIPINGQRISEIRGGIYATQRIAIVLTKRLAGVK